MVWDFVGSFEAGGDPENINDEGSHGHQLS